jgi:hypothetical protein
MTGDWLESPRGVRILWLIAAAILALSVLAELILPRPGHFGFDGWFAFGAWFGFAACVVLILGSKLLGVLLKRPDDYYAD